MKTFQICGQRSLSIKCVCVFHKASPATVLVSTKRLNSVCVCKPALRGVDVYQAFDSSVDLLLTNECLAFLAMYIFFYM